MDAAANPIRSSHTPRTTPCGMGASGRRRYAASRVVRPCTAYAPMIRCTCTADREPPRAVGMPRTFSSAATWRRLDAPPARMSARIGARSAVRALAASCLTAIDVAGSINAPRARLRPPRDAIGVELLLVEEIERGSVVGGQWRGKERTGEAPAVFMRRAASPRKGYRQRRERRPALARMSRRSGVFAPVVLLLEA